MRRALVGFFVFSWTVLFVVGLHAQVAPTDTDAYVEGTVRGISNVPRGAVYDVRLGAPVCAHGSSCDSRSLLDGRGSLGPGRNQPDTLDSCTDGDSGTYHSDESNDRIVVTNLSGQGFKEGDTVEIAATVWAWFTGSSDSADFYYAADAENPSWTYVGSVVPSAGGAQRLTQQYVLPAGSLQAVPIAASILRQFSFPKRRPSWTQ